MLLSELIEHLSEILESNGDATVRIARQPSWPLAGEVGNIWDPVSEPDVSDYDDEGGVDDEPDVDEAGNRIIWIASTEGLEDRDASPYAPHRAFGEDYL